MRRTDRASSSGVQALSLPPLLNTQDMARSTPESWIWLDDWRAISTASHPNLLLQGTGHATDKALIILAPYLRQPLQEWYGDMPLPSLNCEGTLILHDAETMELWLQHDLLRWIEETAGRVQVVTVSRTPLFRLIQRQRFMDQLYYRLNAVYLDVNPRRSSRQIAARAPLSSITSIR